MPDSIWSETNGAVLEQFRFFAAYKPAANLGSLGIAPNLGFLIANPK
jgi:hypothetical protein